ncbi:MAG: hypothetical protein HY381_00845 [Candidatus Chisholmbacteria bacterium]|nr:hypothetical protein [Candidatus Chisholmbacteria bacterium]
MTSVDSKARDGGIGTIMKYFLFQAAHEASGGAVDVFTWTYDPMQGRNARVNLGHLGAICGFAGGLFEEDAYGSNTGAKQHSGNPTDRFHVVYNRTSAWAQAHFNGHVLHPSTEEVKKFAKTNQITFETPEANSAMPGEVNLRATDKFIVMPIPYDWDKLLVVDGQNGFKQATAWRSALREVFGHYFNHGWTAVDLIPNKSEHQNYILLCRDFDPNHPPAELLK